jgi:hypothetical protein
MGGEADLLRQCPAAWQASSGVISDSSKSRHATGSGLSASATSSVPIPSAIHGRRATPSRKHAPTPRSTHTAGREHSYGNPSAGTPQRQRRDGPRGRRSTLRAATARVDGYCNFNGHAVDPRRIA